MNPTVKIHLQNGIHFNTYMYQVRIHFNIYMYQVGIHSNSYKLFSSPSPTVL